ncbi:glycoside hydrolase family 16 protein [Chitinophagaceae bacterium 26-R-25]|nr:glycoside hydrolase family 16 protein [Chitinophagaceae bacterium 26-R-25]
MSNTKKSLQELLSMSNGIILLAMCCINIHSYAQKQKGYALVWSDEFSKNGKPDTSKWSYEHGFVRNEEDQWYQPENANCRNGILVIEAKRVQQPNPNYVAGSKDWRKNREMIQYTSACLITRNKQQWQYGRFIMRARIDVSAGMWPAWWMLGATKPWPGNGEIDMMEYYRGKLLANIACLDYNGKAKWYSKTKTVEAEWASRFHIWRMDRDSSAIALYVDDSLINRTPLDSLINRDGSNFSPFKQPAYMLLNLAIGGQNGGDPSQTKFPKKFEVDYVRVYKKKE